MRISGLFLLLLSRLIIQILLYKTGFIALTADDFGRTVLAAQWANDPYIAWHGIWLPFSMYLFGSILLLKWDLYYMPRIFVIGIGLGSIILIYLLTNQLFNNRRVAFCSAVLLAVNPVHIWLSSTPLVGIINFTLILGATFWYIRYKRTSKSIFIYLAAGTLTLATGFRYESWIIVIIFTLFLLAEIILKIKKRESVSITNLSIVMAMPWTFITSWLLGNYINTGDFFYFATSYQTYQIVFYGQASAYDNYLRMFMRIDPYATLLSIVGIFLCIYNHKQLSSGINLYLSINIIPFITFAILQGGKIIPEGNYYRYLAPFIFITYPAIAYTIDIGIQFVVKSSNKQLILLTIINLFIATTQLNATFQFNNDPSTLAIDVGQKIKEIRQQNPDIDTSPVVIEVSYWDYLAIHVGANDNLTTLVYDRPLDFAHRDAPSLFVQPNFTDSLGDCLVKHKPSFVVVKTDPLQSIISELFNSSPTEQVHGYSFFRVPEELYNQYPIKKNCALPVGNGYN